MSVRPSIVCALVALAGCSGQTQLVVVVDTNLEVPVEIDTVEVVVTGPSGVRTVAPQSLVGADVPGFPLTLGVTPGGDALGPVDVIAVGTLGGVEVVRSAARVTLVAGETRTVTLVLLRGCVGRQCGADRTCGPDGCVSPEDVELAPWTGEPEPFTDPDPCLALPWDVDGDGDGDVACGGDDCDDDEPRRYGGAVEDCDGVDNNCDGQVDEDCACTPVAAVEPCINECGSTGQRVCEATGWSACALLPETCNGDDDDCDGRADEGFDYEPTIETRVSTTDAASAGPRVLFVDDRWSIVWSDTDEEAGIFYASLDRDAIVAVAPTRVAGQGLRPDFAWSGSAYGLSWSRRDGSSTCCTTECTSMCTVYQDRVLTLVFGPDGAPLTTTEQIEADAATQPGVRVVWDGEAFATTYLDGGLFLYRFGADNVGLGARTSVPATNPQTADLLWDGAQYALAYTRSGDVVAFLRGDRSGFATAEQLVASTEGAQDATLARSSVGFVSAWNYEAEGGTFLDRAMVLAVAAMDGAGSPSAAPFVLSSTINGEGGFNRNEADPPSLIGAGAQVLVAWVDQRDLDREVYFARIAPDGAVIQDATRLTMAIGDAHDPSAAWGNGQLGVAWSDERDGNAEIYFARATCPPLAP